MDVPTFYFFVFAFLSGYYIHHLNAFEVKETEREKGSRKTTIKCSKYQFKCENKVECIDYIDTCNFKADCSDQSDEWKPNCAITNETSCILPKQTPDKSYALNCKDGITKRKQIQGDRAGPYAALTFTCNPGYTKENENNMFISYCVNGAWSPPISECKKICERLVPINLEIECFRNDIKIDCNGPLLSGTTVHSTCQQQYALKQEGFEKITCNENGLWDKPLPECVLECGKVHGNESSLQRIGGANNYNYFPWHVAIYDVRNIPFLIRSGTIISPILILTVMKSIYDETTSEYLNPEDVQIVVSKVTPNYFIQDNEFQKTYEVQEIYHFGDYAIFEVKDRIHFNLGVIPACIGMSFNEDDRSYFSANKVNAKIASWGVINNNHNDENTFRIDDYEISAYHRCAYESDKFCGRLIYGAGTNLSDTGAGLLYENTDGRFYVIGIMNKKYKNDENQYAIIATNLESHYDNEIDTIYQRTAIAKLLDEEKSNYKTRTECEYGTFFNSEKQRASVCLKQNLKPIMPPCKKTCNALQIRPHMKFNCTYNDIPISCDNEPVENTKIYIECEKGYKPLNSPNYQHIICQEDGKWSNEIFTCVESSLKTCILPHQTKDKTFKINCKNHLETYIDPESRSVDEFTLLSFECKPGYFRKKGNNFQALCLNGTWTPEIERCTPFCKTFLSLNLNPECYYNDEKIDCNQPLKPGTQIRPYCERYYRKKYTEFEELVCKDDGDWDNIPIECVHPCGSEVTHEVDRHFDFRMTSVQVSIIDKKTKANICAGTVLTPYLVVTTARCFYNTDLHKVNPASEYEIVAGKKTGLLPSFPKDFLKLMSDNRKIYQVHQIYYTNKGKTKILENFSEDLALIETTEKIQFNANTYPACVNWDHIDKFDVTPFFSLTGDNSAATAAEVCKLETDYFQHDGSYIGSDIRFRYFQHYPFDVCRRYLKNEKGNKPDIMCVVMTDVKTHQSLVFQSSRVHTKTKLQLLYEISQMDDINHPIFQFKLNDPDYGVGYLQKKSIDGNTYIQGIYSGKTSNSSAILMINLNYHSHWLKRIKDYVERRRVIKETKKSFQIQNYNLLEESRFDTDLLQNFTYQSIKVYCERNHLRRHFIRGCNLPDSNHHNIQYEVSCSEEYSSYCHNVQDNSSVPETSKLAYMCKPGYAMVNHWEQGAYCRQVWIPPIEVCKKTCKKLKPINVKLFCTYEGKPVDCNGKMLENTIVEPKCLPEYEPESAPNYTELKCLPEGEWSNVLFSCKPKCGRSVPGKVTTLIKGGYEAQFGEFPWHVGIFDKTSSNPLICGGSIISPYVIVSAAHCFFDNSNETIRTPKNYEIAVGKISRSKKTKDSEVTKFYEVESIIIDNYRGVALRYQYDIAILQTKNKIEFNYLVTPICVNYASNIRIPANELLKVCGWGLDDDNLVSEKLRVTEMPYLSVSDCFTKAPRSISEYISVDKFCVGSVNGSIVERGDSGGGLSFVDDTTSLRLHYLVGIVSIKPLGAPTVAVITDVNQYIPWILKHMNEIHRIKQYDVIINN